MDTLDYASPEKTTGARSTSTVALVAAVSAWGAIVAVGVVRDDWPALLFPVLSLLAVWFGIVARKEAGPGPSADRSKATVGLWLGAVQLSLFLAALMVLPSTGRPREPAQRLKCASNLRQIGQGIQIYAHEHGGAFPSALDDLLISGDLTSEIFICPSSDHERATGATTQAVIANFRATPLHCSYVYVGGDLTGTTATAAHVVAYEQTTNHERQGMNVLYGDGTVNWLDARDAQHLVSELNAGNNPPRQRPQSP
jgi:hypothetical protein